MVQAIDLGSGTLDGQTYAYAVDSASSGIQWKSNNLYFGTPTLGPDGTTYILLSQVDSYYGKVPHALQALSKDGSVKWKVSVDGWCSNPVVDSSGNIYLSIYSMSGYDSQIISYNSAGATRWVFNLTQEYPDHWDLILGNPVVHPDGNVIAHAYHRLDSTLRNSTLFSIDQSGHVVWDLDIISAVNTVFVGPLAGSMIYVTSYGSMVQGIDPDGSLLWTRDFGPEGAYITYDSMVGPEGDLYTVVSGIDEVTHGQNMSVPEEIWCMASNGTVVFKTTLFADTSTLYYCGLTLSAISSNGTIYCQNTKGYGSKDDGTMDDSKILVSPRAQALSPQGEVMWSYVLPNNETFDSKALITASTAYLFPLDSSEVGRIVALQLDNGSLLGTYSAPNKLWLSGAAVGDDERFLYFEGTYKGAEEGIITLVSTVGLPQVPVPRPLDLMAATVAWGSIFGLMLGGGYYVTHKRRL